MTIITYEIDSTPRGVIKRLERKNDKNTLAMTLQQIRTVSFDNSISDSEKLKMIQSKILDRLF